MVREEVSSATVIVRLFGSFEANHNGMPINGLALNSAYKLLALLVLWHTKWSSTVTLLGRLWPDHEGTDTTPYGPANKSIQTLEDVLGSLQKERRGTQWHWQLPTENVWADTLFIEEAIKSGNLDDLEYASTLCRGQLLEDFPDETWAIEESSHWKGAQKAEISKKIKMASEQGNSDKIEAYSRLATAIDQDTSPHNEFLKPLTLKSNQATIMATGDKVVRTTLVQVGRKYLSHLYIEREIDQTINEFLTRNHGSLFIVVDRAGNGKTSLICHLCETQGNQHILFFMRCKYLTNMWQDFLEMFEHITETKFIDNVSGITSSAADEKLLTNCLVLIDGLNEYANTKDVLAHLFKLLSELLPRKIKVILTCRDLFWEALRNDIEEAFGEFTKPGTLQHSLGKFRTNAVSVAVEQHFNEFNIRGELMGQALDACRFPLLLRFFCEAYEGRTVGPVHDIRLKSLFDEYSSRKTNAISAELIGLSPNNIMAMLCDLAMRLFKSEGNNSTYSDIAASRSLSGTIVNNVQLYHRILDENIIIETEKTLSRGAIISFVYDEFMEYLCARHFIEGLQPSGQWDSLSRSSLTDILREGYNSFKFSNIAEYMMAMSRDDYKSPIWQEMFNSGVVWHPAIVRALCKIPSGELDEAELTLLLHLCRYEGSISSPEARRIAKAALAERFSYFTEAERERIWWEVKNQWANDQQAIFVSDNFHILGEDKWVLLKAIAKDRLGRGHEELLALLDRNCTQFSSHNIVHVKELITLLQASVVRSIGRQADKYLTP